MVSPILVICFGLVLATNALPLDNKGSAPQEEAVRTEYPDLKTALMDILSTKDFIEIIQNSVNFTAPSHLQLRSQQSRCHKIGVPYGGIGGGPFDDQRFCGQHINTIRADKGGCSGDATVVTQLDIEYATGESISHGTRGDSTTTVNLIGQEYLIGVVLNTGTLVDDIIFLSCKNGNVVVHGQIGGSGGSTRVLLGRIEAFYGRAGSCIDQLGIESSQYNVNCGPSD